MHDLARTFGRFALVGLVATAVHAAVFALVIETTPVDPVAATVPAFVIALLTGFSLNRRWTFARSNAPVHRVVRYLIAALAGLALSAALMHFAVHLQGWSPYAGLALGILAVPPVTFALNRWWVFAPQRQA
jgi:putative flippase GtrA